jgi:hypothetical protein
MCPLYLRYMVRKHIQGWNWSMLQELKTTKSSYKLKTNSNSLEDHKPPPRNGQCSAANSWMGQHQLVKVSNRVDNDTMDMKKIRRCTYRCKLSSFRHGLSLESSTIRLGHRRISQLAVAAPRPGYFFKASITAMTQFVFRVSNLAAAIPRASHVLTL